MANMHFNATPSLWLQTPLIFSNHLSSLLDCDVYLKLEVCAYASCLEKHISHKPPFKTQNLQPSQSFKHRGISYFAQRAKESHGANVHLIVASGGNAGLAAASAAKQLGLKCTVFLPLAVSKNVHDLLRKDNAEVVAVGEDYLQSLHEAEKAVKLDPNA